MFFNVTPDRCAKETSCQNCSSRTICLSPTHRIGRFPLKEGAQNVLTAVRTSSTLTDAAKEVGISRSSIRRVLASQGLTAEELRKARM